ncbi:hypothetical protein ACLOJK_025196 [Asimina triloba]
MLQASGFFGSFSVVSSNEGSGSLYREGKRAEEVSQKVPVGDISKPGLGLGFLRGPLELGFRRMNEAFTRIANSIQDLAGVCKDNRAGTEIQRPRLFELGLNLKKNIFKVFLGGCGSKPGLGLGFLRDPLELGFRRRKEAFTRIANSV